MLVVAVSLLLGRCGRLLGYCLVVAGIGLSLVAAAAADAAAAAAAAAIAAPAADVAAIAVAAWSALVIGSW